jgi:hypothetical protein
MDRNTLPDDPSIGPDTVLWRRIPPEWIVPHADGKGLRISSAAFDDSKDGDPMSVYIADVVEATGGSVDTVL